MVFRTSGNHLFIENMFSRLWKQYFVLVESNFVFFFKLHSRQLKRVFFLSSENYFLTKNCLSERWKQHFRPAETIFEKNNFILANRNDFSVNYIVETIFLQNNFIVTSINTFLISERNFCIGKLILVSFNGFPTSEKNSSYRIALCQWKRPLRLLKSFFIGKVSTSGSNALDQQEPLFYTIYSF